MVRPASRQMSTSRVASATSLAPQALKNSLPPPNVPVPKLNTGTLNPEPPSCRYSIGHSPARVSGTFGRHGMCESMACNTSSGDSRAITSRERYSQRTVAVPVHEDRGRRVGVAAVRLRRAGG